MSYFKELYAKIVGKGYSVKSFRCECGTSLTPVGFDGKYFLIACTNPDCRFYGKETRRKAKR